MAVKPKRIIGIDFGIARLGIAISDERCVIAMPYKTMKASKKTEQTIASLLEVIKELENQSIISEIVIGLPLMMSGKVGFLADEVKHFASLLKEAIALPITLWDERLTTVQAERSLRESSFSRKKRTQHVDTVAAVIILQNFLDHKACSESKVDVHFD